MKKLLLIVFITNLLVLPVRAGDIIVIVNPSSTVSSLSKKELVDLYMGKKVSFFDGSIALLLDQQMGSPLRERFYKNMINKSVAEVNAYWARLLFTGRATPPRPVPDSEAVIHLVEKNPDAIGYIDSHQLNSSVKEVYRVP